MNHSHKQPPEDYDLTRVLPKFLVPGLDPFPRSLIAVELENGKVDATLIPGHPVEIGKYLLTPKQADPEAAKAIIMELSCLYVDSHGAVYQDGTHSLTSEWHFPGTYELETMLAIASVIFSHFSDLAFLYRESQRAWYFQKIGDHPTGGWIPLRYAGEFPPGAPVEIYVRNGSYCLGRVCGYVCRDQHILIQCAAEQPEGAEFEAYFSPQLIRENNADLMPEWSDPDETTERGEEEFK